LPASAWLVPLVTPKDGLVLDCFAGSGTTGIAALATGRNAILVEKEAEYISDIRERMSFYEGEGRHSIVAKSRNAREPIGTLL
jgi:site-specific DNA-methyltransferase (adenine-specific)